MRPKTSGGKRSDLMNSKELSIQGENKRRLLVMALLNTDQYSYLPELLDIFGEDKLLQFLDVFSGCKVEVPSRDKLNRSMREIEIYNRMESKNKPTYAKIAQEYKVSEEYIRVVHNKVKSMLLNTNEVITKIIK